MSHDDERSPSKRDAGHRRRSLLSAIVASFGLVLPTAVVGEPKKRRDKKGKNKRKHNHNTPDHGGCQVNESEQQILNYIAQAAKKYGQSKTVMERVARCESSLNPCAVNASGPYYGLYQYLKSTWTSTPYGNRSIWDPEAQALATGWMWQQGRKNEWACQ
jgi:hypothetical protein